MILVEIVTQEGQRLDVTQVKFLGVIQLIRIQFLLRLIA